VWGCRGGPPVTPHGFQEAAGPRAAAVAYTGYVGQGIFTADRRSSSVTTVGPRPCHQPDGDHRAYEASACSRGRGRAPRHRCHVAGRSGGAGRSAATTGPCGALTAAPTYTHVIWVWMENHSYDIDSDCSPSKHCSTSAPSLFGRGEMWKAYQESMTANCDKSNAGEYAVRHNRHRLLPSGHVRDGVRDEHRRVVRRFRVRRQVERTAP